MCEVNYGDAQDVRVCGECRVFNMGGPERLSRVDMAQRVSAAWALDPQYIVQQDSGSIQRTVASPADISMDISRLRQVTFHCLGFATFQSCCLRSYIGALWW